MKGLFKAKKSYAKAKKSYKNVSFKKHERLLNGEEVFLESNPRLLGDMSKYLTECKTDNEDK